MSLLERIVARLRARHARNPGSHETIRALCIEEINRMSNVELIEYIDYAILEREDFRQENS